MLKISAHQLVMTKIIKEIYSDISIGSVLGFKGGTALKFFYDLPRFSVDLDFDLIDDSKKDLVFKKITKIAKKFGDLQENRDKYFTLFWLLSYQKGLNHLKIEISKRNAGNSFEAKNYLGLPALVMKPADMFANKLAAFLGRKRLANRDIFDIWFMLDKHWDLNEELLQQRVGMAPEKYLRRCLKFLKTKPPVYILEGLGELLDNRMKIWVKNKLLEETIFLLKLRLEPN